MGYASYPNAAPRHCFTVKLLSPIRPDHRCIDAVICPLSQHAMLVLFPKQMVHAILDLCKNGDHIKWIPKWWRQGTSFPISFAVVFNHVFMSFSAYWGYHFASEVLLQTLLMISLFLRLAPRGWNHRWLTFILYLYEQTINHNIDVLKTHQPNKKLYTTTILMRIFTVKPDLLGLVSCLGYTPCLLTSELAALFSPRKMLHIFTQMLACSSTGECLRLAQIWRSLG